MQPKLVIAFDTLSEADFQAKVGHILSSLTNNPNFPEPLPEPVPSLAQLNEVYRVYLDAYHASLTRDTSKIKHRDAARQTLTGMLKHLANYLEVIAHLDTDKLSTTGFDLRKSSVRGIYGGILPAPADFKIAHGPKSGTLLLHVARLAGAKGYDVQMAQGGPGIEGNWQHATHSATGTHILLQGLTPAQTYWFRVCAIGSGGKGVWTGPVSVIVV
jgi:hypothetical protein